MTSRHALCLSLAILCAACEAPPTVAARAQAATLSTRVELAFSKTTTGSSPSQPLVVRVDDDYWISYVEGFWTGLNTDPATAALYLRRIDSDGNPLEASPRALEPQGAQSYVYPPVILVGDTVVAVLWSANGPLKLQRFTHAFQPIDATPVVLEPDCYAPTSAALAGDTVLANCDLRGYLFHLGDAPVSPTPVAIFPDNPSLEIDGARCCSSLSVASNGTSFVAIGPAQKDGSLPGYPASVGLHDDRIVTRPIAADGTLGSPLAVVSGFVNVLGLWEPRLAWTGSDFFATWTTLAPGVAVYDEDPEHRQYDLYSRRLDGDGVPLAGDMPVVLTPAPGIQLSPTLLPLPGGLFVAFQDDESCVRLPTGWCDVAYDHGRAVGMFVRSDGRVADRRPIELRSPAYETAAVTTTPEGGVLALTASKSLSAAATSVYTPAAPLALQRLTPGAAQAGESCSTGSDCASLACVGGLCCDGACPDPSPWGPDGGLVIPAAEDAGAPDASPALPDAGDADAGASPDLAPSADASPPSTIDLGATGAGHSGGCSVGPSAHPSDALGALVLVLFLALAHLATRRRAR